MAQVAHKRSSLPKRKVWKPILDARKQHVRFRPELGYSRPHARMTGIGTEETCSPRRAMSAHGGKNGLIADIAPLPSMTPNRTFRAPNCSPRLRTWGLVSSWRCCHRPGVAERVLSLLDSGPSHIVEKKIDGRSHRPLRGASAKTPAKGT